MKKILVILLALAMLFAFAACTPPADKKADDADATASDDATDAADDEQAADDAADAADDAQAADDAADDTQAEKMDAADVKVGFIYVGPVGDGGFTYMHDQGRQEMEAALGVETIYLENIGENTDCADALDALVKQGCNVIFATSFGHMDYTEEAAAKYPDVTFVHCSGFKMNDTNFGNYFGRMYEPRYLSGIAAGYATETNQIGYVAAFGIPEVIRGIDAFTLGVRSVNPDATVQIVWTNTWYDPVLEKASAESLLDAGCDVIAMHQDTPEPIAAAAAAGAYGVGYHSEMAASGGETYLTAPVWNLGPYYTKIVQSVMDGTFKPEAFWGGLAEGTVTLEAFGPGVSEEAAAAIEEAKAAIIDGSLQVFAGPIKDADGNIVVEEGAVMTDEEMLSMEFYVEGVQGGA